MIIKNFAAIFLVSLTAIADDLLPVLKVNGDVYSNVNITTVTATDVFFTHAKGVGNAKLRSLPPDLQKHFHFDAAKDAQMQKQQATNTILYHQYLLTAKAPPSAKETSERSASGDNDFVAPQLYARSFRGQPSPPFAVEEWVTPKPDITGKFVLLDYWATWCGPCRHSIPQLNAFSKKYRSQLVVVGISDEKPDAVRRMTDPRIEYAVAVDTQARMMRALGITGIPHCILVDPHGIVRYEGMPGFLDDEKLEHFLEKYQ